VPRLLLDGQGAPPRGRPDARLLRRRRELRLKHDPRIPRRAGERFLGNSREPSTSIGDAIQRGSWIKDKIPFGRPIWLD
jgi:hypothetical protein